MRKKRSEVRTSQLTAVFATCGLAALLASPAHAQEAEPSDEAPAVEASESDLDAAIRLSPVVVIGSAERAWELPGSGAYVGTDDIRTQNYDDPNRALRKVPGVYVRPEDGLGLFPNISLRGADTTRSAKLTLMEDGVLTAPAPYSAPAAYYSPTTGRMHAIEVLKGSSQIRFGPHTTSGVVNYVSTPIPETPRGYARVTYGTDQDTRLHAYYGGHWETCYGRVGLLAEGYFRKTDGFKSIDRAPDFHRGDEAGFDKTEPMLKAAWEPKTDWYQRFEAKWGKTDLDADETYLGLSERDFSRDPNRRYAASRFDNIETEQERNYFRWYGEPTDSLEITLTAYYNSFERNWFKIRRVNDGTSNFSLAEALARGGRPLAVLRGEAAGRLDYRNNARTYYGKGYDARVSYSHTVGEMDWRWTVGLRDHEDRVRRFQQDEAFTQAANGAITGRTVGPPGGGGDRRQSVEALSWFVENEITWERWTFTPGFRSEDLRLQHRDNQDLSTRGRESLDLDAAGLGVTYDASDRWSFFGGVYEGFSPPSPRAHIKDDLDEETSLGWELGARHQSDDGAFRAESTLFLTEFEDLIVIDNLASSSGNSNNAGEVETRGIEFAAAWDAGIANGWSFSNLWFLTATWTDAEIGTPSNSGDAESIFAGAKSGNDVPYIPEWTLNVGTRVEHGAWTAELSGTYVDETYTTGSNTSRQVAPDGTPDARFGKTDSYWVFDLGVTYEVREGLRLLGGIQNIFEDEYVTARHPEGPRPGKPRFTYVGLELDF